MTLSKKILVTLESRATYGYSRNVLRQAKSSQDLEFYTLVTGGHLIQSIGGSKELITKDGFTIDECVSFEPHGESSSSWSKAMGQAITGYSDAIERIAPDIVLIFGDRIETLSLCMTASYMGLPVAHVQAGDKSGHIDDCARYAIAKLAHLHFASCEDSANRLRSLGEQEFRIFNTGAPQLDDIHENSKKKTVRINELDFDIEQDFILLLYHPLMSQREQTSLLVKAAVEAVLSFNLPIIWIYPNNDLGYQDILSTMISYKELKNVHTVSNLDRDDFLSLLRRCNVLVGNSSSGILEAPSFQTPVVNIGDRQRGRPQASNIINCTTDYESVKSAISKALYDDKFHTVCNQAINPYGDGQSAKRICNLLSTITLNNDLLDKQTTY